MSNEGLAQHVHTLTTRLWYRLVNNPGGPPGVAGPLSEDAPWDATAGYLVGAIATLEQALAQPDPVRILRDLNEARPLGDIAYDIREREAQGWDGPKVTKWGKAADDAAKLLEGRQPRVP